MTDHSIVLCGGGTGGHLFPALATARILRDEYHARVTLFSDRLGEEEGIQWMQFYLPRKNNRIQRPLFWITIVVQFLLFFLRFLLKRPRVVVGFGGYASFPVLFAAQCLRIPTLLHEQNAILGRVNRLFAKRAKRIALSFEKTKGIEKENDTVDKIVLTGNPIRFETLPPAPNRRENSLHIFVVGGSQGANIFSMLVPSAIALLPEKIRNRLSVTQQCRPEDLASTKKRYKSLGISAELESFFNNMPQEYAKADLIIARAGSSTIAEVATAGLPGIFIPYPYAADDHQFHNANALEDSALVFRQENLTPEILAHTLEDLFLHPLLRQDYAAKITQHAKKDAALMLAKIVIDAIA